MLRGLRVLDLSQYLPGPYAAQILADLGAEVVKVEPPAGDPLRALGPRDPDGLSAYYKLLNAGKTVIRLDLKATAGKAAFRALLTRTDALIESFRPGAFGRLGFAPDALAAINPRLVHCALSGYGHSGPYARRAGHDLNYMALSGGLAASGSVARPEIAYPPTADFAGGLQAALAVLAGLLRRQATGAGGFLDVSLAETVLAWQAVTLTGALRQGHEPARAGVLLNGGAACYRIYRTSDDRFVTLGALEEKFWANFCRAVGRAEWIGRQGEPLPQDALIGQVATLFAGRPLAHWDRVLDGIECCYQPVLEPAAVPDHPQVRARGLVRRRAGSSTSGGPAVEVGLPLIIDGQAPAARAPLVEKLARDVVADWGRASS